jgi:vacuolar-type H+-ATPase subunit D/Vma8
MPIVMSNSDKTPSDIPKSLTALPDSTPSPSSSPSPTYSPALSASDPGEVPSSASTPSITLEEKIQQLNQTLSLLQSERDTLAVSLKTTRRDAQRADAAIRADIETLKRASDKFASVEHRARQKVLALQETVKQTLAAAEDINASVTDAETSLPILRGQQAEAEKECKVARQQAAQAREEREALERHEKKQIDSLQTELAGLGSKLEKLNCKREKLEKSIIPELEEELRRIEVEIAAATRPSPPPHGSLRRLLSRPDVNWGEQPAWKFISSSGFEWIP